MNKKDLTEADIRTKFITPALVGPDGNKWDVMTQLREEVFFTIRTNLLFFTKGAPTTHVWSYEHP